MHESSRAPREDAAVASRATPRRLPVSSWSGPPDPRPGREKETCRRAIRTKAVGGSTPSGAPDDKDPRVPSSAAGEHARSRREQATRGASPPVAGDAVRSRFYPPIGGSPRLLPFFFPVGEGPRRSEKAVGRRIRAAAAETPWSSIDRGADREAGKRQPGKALPAGTGSGSSRTARPQRDRPGELREWRERPRRPARGRRPRGRAREGAAFSPRPREGRPGSDRLAGRRHRVGRVPGSASRRGP